MLLYKFTTVLLFQTVALNCPLLTDCLNFIGYASHVMYSGPEKIYRLVTVVRELSQ